MDESVRALSSLPLSSSHLPIHPSTNPPDMTQPEPLIPPEIAFEQASIVVLVAIYQRDESQFTAALTAMIRVGISPETIQARIEQILAVLGIWMQTSGDDWIDRYSLTRSWTQHAIDAVLEESQNQPESGS